MKNRFIKSLIITLTIWFVTHIIFLTVGYMLRTDVGMFQLPMLWAHITNSWQQAIVGLCITLAIFFFVFFFFTGRKADPHADETDE